MVGVQVIEPGITSCASPETFIGATLRSRRLGAPFFESELRDVVGDKCLLL